MKKRVVCCVVVALMVLTMLTGCASNAPAGNAAADGQLTFGVTVSMITGYYSAMTKAIEETAAKMNIKLVLLVAENDTTKQNQQMENLIAQRVDAIICNPEDGTAIATSVQKAMDAGIPVVMVDRMVDGATPSKQIINDSYQLSVELLEWFVGSELGKNVTTPLKTLVMVGSMADSYAVNCLAAHREVIKANPKVFNLIAEIPGEWNQDTALKGVQNALSSNPDIDLIITPSDMYLPPIKSALEQINRWQKRGEDGHVMILSTDGDSYGMQCIKDGYTEADAVVDAAACGSWGVEYAYKIVKGEVEADGEIAAFPGFVVTYENFDELAPSVYSYEDLK